MNFLKLFKKKTMEINPKFKLGQEVYFMYCNEVTKRIVKSIHLAVYYGEQSAEYTLNYVPNKFFKEDEIFETKEELLKSL